MQVVVDCGPTAETLRLLGLPEAIGGYLERLYPARRRAVRGLLAPLVINAGLGALADAACRHWQLPAEECNDLWCGAGT